MFARREHVAKRASARGKCEPQTHFPFGFSLSRRLGQPRRGVPNPPFPDPNALAIEVKSSWALAAGLPNLSSYIIITATIPTYNQPIPICGRRLGSKPRSWPWWAYMLSVAQRDIRKWSGPPARNNAESMDASRARRARRDTATRIIVKRSPSAEMPR